MENNQKYILGAIVVAALIIATGFAINIAGNGNNTRLDAFAKCTASKGLTMYGAVWCSHCAAQKKLFSDSFQYVNYVECPDNIKLCTDKGVSGFPTWIDSAGKKYEGEQSLDTIALITGCELPK